MGDLLQTLNATGSTYLGGAWPVVYALIKIMAVVVPILAAVAYLTL